MTPNFKKISIALIVAFVAGWIINGWRWESKWSRFEAEANQQALKQAQSVRQIEASWQELVKLTSIDLKNDYTAINQKYQNALRRINDLSGQLERVQPNSASDTSAMPKTTSTANRVGNSCKCRSFKPHGRGVEEALAIARDCDVLATKYNKLLVLYESMRLKNMAK